MSRTRFGEAALGDPSFVTVFGRGRSPRLDTADRLLAFMGLEPIGPGFRREVDAFLAVTGAKSSELGREVSGNPSFVSWLRRGGSPRLATVDKARAWIEARRERRGSPGDPGHGVRGRGDPARRLQGRLRHGRRHLAVHGHA